MMMNGEKLELIRRVLDAPATFDTDDALAAIEMIVNEELDPFDDDIDPVTDAEVARVWERVKCVMTTDGEEPS